MSDHSEPYPHTDFDGAFTRGTVFKKGKRRFKMETTQWGKLVVPSGRIVANDAIAGLERAKPLKRTIPPGKYSVVIASNGSETCAMMVRFSRRKPVVWEPAVLRGEKLKASDRLNPPCFSVDSGMAGLFDAKAAKIASRDKNWSQRIDTSHAIEVDNESKAGMVWCHSGYGDGAYPCYWGLDSSGEVACLVVDFLVLVDDIYDEHVITELDDKVNTEFVDPWFSQFDCKGVRLAWSKKTNEFRFEYRSGKTLFSEISLFNRNGGQVWRGGESGAYGIPGDPNCIQYFKRTFNVSTDKKAKLVIRGFRGVHSLPRVS